MERLSFDGRNNGLVLHATQCLHLSLLPICTLQLPGLVSCGLADCGVVAIAAVVAGGFAVKAWRDKSAALQALRARAVRDFHDPESARFRDLSLRYLGGTISDRLAQLRPVHLWRMTPGELLELVVYRPDGFELCGQVNAKNSFGAYVGYSTFSITAFPDDARVSVDRDGETFAQSVCKISAPLIVARADQ